MAEGKITRRGGGVNVKDATATENDVLQGETFYSVDKDIKTGNIPSKGAETFTPTTSNQTISSGQYLTGTQTILGDSDLVPDNIKDGTTIFNVTGTLEVVPEPTTFISATGGTTNTYSRNGKYYKTHTFTSSGTLTINSLSDVESYNYLDYLIIAGGGGGAGGGFGTTRAGGAGGAGGFRTTVGVSGGGNPPESKTLSNTQSYTITVGAGGSGGNQGTANVGGRGNSGTNSSALGITSNGGGYGGYDEAGGSGGSGGGGGGSNPETAGSGTSGQGTNGGRGESSYPYGGGGGGGAAEAGFNSNSNTIARAGVGLPCLIEENPTPRAAGGGGGVGRHTIYDDKTGETIVTADNVRDNPRPYGGGGHAGSGTKQLATAGLVNTGSGGGGGSGDSMGIQGRDGGAGGSGIVIIRYEVGEL